MCGSPGSGAESIDQYNVPEGHVYESSVPKGDMVQGSGSFIGYGSNPKTLDGIVHLNGDTTDAKDYKVPGANWARDFFHPGKELGNIIGDPFVNHMSYFDKDTRAFQDFANIIGGGKQTTDEEWAAIEKERGK